MELNLQNIREARSKLKGCDIVNFRSDGESFVYFISKLEVIDFRHIKNLVIDFKHPVTVIAGSNKIGKTSLLILLACSHEKFIKIDATSPKRELREHVWNDVIGFTAHESETKDYSYKITWRVGTAAAKTGEGKRLASSKAWTGLGKKSSAKDRLNAKIRDREVRMIDLERMLPARSFSDTLYRKANNSTKVRLKPEIEKAFCYIFNLVGAVMYEVGSHVNKSCFIIKSNGYEYSSYNAASGEEAMIYLLIDMFAAPKNSLILVDEIEAGFHPAVQRKIANVIQYISWIEKKQFVITTHSPTFLSSFPGQSRVFIEAGAASYKAISGVSRHAAASKMDSLAHPLITLYCEDDIAAFLIRKVIQGIGCSDDHFSRLYQIIKSGPVDQVKNDYVRHKRNFPQLQNKIGYAAVFDGDYKDHPLYSNYFNNSSEEVCFLYPFEAPEKFLVRSFLRLKPNPELQSALAHTDHHSLFQEMVNLGLAADIGDARGRCYDAFEKASEYSKHKLDLTEFLVLLAEKFSEMTIDSDELFV